ncbi:hypothetical protein GmHk_02G005941 [Glycine max]|nr:hypothetical protein GmHk_02G005941 [Glycine max]
MQQQEQTHHDAYGGSSRFGCRRHLLLGRRSGGERGVFDLLGAGNGGGGSGGGSGFFGDDLREVKGLSEFVGGE